jgi:hypothetical protein
MAGVIRAERGESQACNPHAPWRQTAILPIAKAHLDPIIAALPRPVDRIAPLGDHALELLSRLMALTICAGENDSGSESTTGDAKSRVASRCRRSSSGRPIRLRDDAITVPFDFIRPLRTDGET